MAGKGKACSSVSDKQAEAIKKSVYKGFRTLGINTGGISYVSIEAALNKLMAEKGYTIEVLFTSEHKQELINTIAQARTQSAKEKAALENDKIGKATVHIGERVTKLTPQQKPNALFVYGENMQAYNAFASEKVGVPGLIAPDRGVTVNVNSTSAVMRTNTNDNKYPNTLGIVTKKNAQSKDGKWLNDGQGVFEDTDADFEAFVKVNTIVLEEIKKRLTAEDSTVEDFYMVDKLALDKAGLPKRFAEALRTMLYQQLGISAQVLPSSFGKDLWGLEIQPFGNKGKNGKEKSAAQQARERDAKEAAESLAKERPVLLSDNLQISKESVNLLARIFPNIEERYARIEFISTVFSQQISDLLEKAVASYEELLKGDHSAEDERVYAAITSGTEAERRRSFLELVPIVRPDGTETSVAENIIETIKNFMQEVVEISDAAEREEISDDDAADLIFGGDSYIAREFAREAEDNNWEGKTLRTQKVRRMKRLGSAFKTMLDPMVFTALMKEAAADIEFNENIRIVLDSGNPIIENTKEDDDKVDDENDGKVDDRTGLSLIKYKLLNPAKTLSTRMKVLLSHLYKKKGGKYEYNSLGQRVRMNSSVAYYILLHHFSAMNRSADFEGAIDEAAQKYPWFAALADQLDEDMDLKREFYTTFRKVFVPYVLIADNGKITRLNQTANRESFMQEVTRLYEGHLPLSADSIYDIEGLPNPKNIAKVHNWVAVSKIKGDKLTSHPLAWVKNIFDNPGRKDFTAENIIKAVEILRGEVEGTPGIEALLHALGVPTDTLDIDVLVPYISEEFKEALRSENPDVRLAAFNELSEAYSSSVRGNISKIIQAAINITREGKGFGGSNPHLLEDFKGAYSNIADALAISSEAISQASFLGVDNAQMFSYTAPDRISILVGILSHAKTKEEAQLYIENEWGKYPFFRDPQTQEWLNSWLEELYENPAVRQAIEYANVLGFGNRNKKNSIQEGENDVFMDGIITAMFSASDASDGTKMGWYRNPLFSDTAALVLLKMPREAGDGYKDRILDKMVKTLRQEIDRIVFVLNQADDTTELEFFNDERANGAKFNFFPELNAKRAEILSTLAEIAETYAHSAVGVKAAQDAYLKNVLRDLIEGEMLPDGSRVGGLLETFLDGISEERGARILRSITAIESEESKEENLAKLEEDALNEDDDLDGLSPEDKEAKKEALSAKQREEVREKLTEFFYNDFFGQIQFTQMIGGDMAQYKSYDDFVKRCKENYAAGERMYALTADGKPITEKAMYVEDLEGVSTTWTSIRDLLDADNPNLSAWERGIYKGAVEMFTNICKTDGQSLRTLDSYKKLFESFGGRWTPAMDRAYNNIKSGHFTAADFLAMWNPIKPFMVTTETVMLKDKDGNLRPEKVQTQHKNSEYLISALFGVLNTALNQSPQLRGIQRFMETHGIDVLHFHSVVKHGGHDFFDVNYNYDKFYREILGIVDLNDPDVEIPETVGYTVGNKTLTFNTDELSFKKFFDALTKALKNGEITQEEYNSTLAKYEFKTEDEVVKALEEQLLDRVTGQEKEGMIKEFPLEDYMIVQPSDDHLIDHDALFGSQLRNIVPADLPADMQFTVNVNGKKVTLTRDEIVQFYNTVIVDQLIDSFDTVDRRFMSDKELSDFLQEMMRGNPKYGDDVKDALSIDPKTGRFKVPLNSPNLRNKVEELLLSSFKNNIQRQKIRGGNVVLVSNFGLSDDLHVKYKNADNPEEGIEYIEAYMPAYMRDMYEDYLVPKTDTDGSTYWTIDFEALEKNHPGDDGDILKVIGYRIPTEDKYSIMPIKIKGFMPVVAGTTIMLPADIIAMSGTDFDIDKLFLMIRATVKETFGPNLATEFKNWLSPEIKKSLANTDPEQDKVIDRIFRRKQGFTDSELNALAEKSPLFTQFMDEKGFEFALDKPHYRIKRGRNITDENGDINLDETSKLSSYSKRERHDIRNNMLIDTIWSIMTSPAGSKLSMLPGSYPGVKRGSRQQWILNNPTALKKFVEVAGGADKVYSKLMSMSPKELEKFYDTYAAPENPFTLNAYVKKHRNLMDGNALIGVFAVNSSNHYKLQFLSPGTTDSEGNYIPSENILLNEANKFLFAFPGETPKVVQLVSPQKSPITGVAIGRIAAEFQAASPDNGKDPCLGDLNASTETAYRINFLIHMGFPPEVIGMLNTIDDFVDYGKLQEVQSKEPFNGDIGRIMELVTKLRTSETGTLADPIDRQDAGRIAKWLDNIFTCARTFHHLSDVSRVDSPNGALPVKAADVILQMLKIEDFFAMAKMKECPIIGLDRLIDDSIDVDKFDSMEELRDAILRTPIPRLQAAYTLGIKSARSIAGSQLVQLRKPVTDAVRMLRKEIKNTLLYGDGPKILQKYLNEMTMFFLSAEGSLFASTEDGKTIMDLRNYYIHDFPAKLKAFLDEKDEKGHYKHANVRNLTLLRRISNSNRTGIKFESLGKVSPLSRKHYTEAMDSLLYSTDPDAQKLAIDLLMYAYYDNGLNFGPRNYGVFFTTFFLTSLPGIMDVLQRVNGQAESDSSFLVNFTKQFLLNHRDFIYAPKFFRGGRNAIKEEGDYLEIPERNADFLRGGADGTGNFITFMRYKGQVYERVIGDSGPAKPVVRYKKVSHNRTDMTGGKKNSRNYTPFYDATKTADEIEWDKLQDRGSVSIDTSKKKQEGNKKKAEDSVPTDPADKDAAVGRAVPEDAEEPTVDNGITAALESLENVPESAADSKLDKLAQAADRLADALEKLEGNFNVPKEPELKEFKDTSDPNNRLCPPTGN